MMATTAKPLTGSEYVVLTYHGGTEAMTQREAFKLAMELLNAIESGVPDVFPPHPQGKKR